MKDKVLAVVLFALCAACQALIRHADTALFFSLLFGALGAYEFIIGEVRQRKAERYRPPPRDPDSAPGGPPEDRFRSGRTRAMP